MLILPTQGKDFLRRCCTYFGINAQKDAILTNSETKQKAGSAVKESQTLFKDLENEQSLALGSRAIGS